MGNVTIDKNTVWKLDTHAHIPTMPAEYLSCEACKYSVGYIELPF